MITRSLQGKVAIVTGAGCTGDGIGNGRAAAILLAEDGASVVCVDRQEDWARKTTEYVAANGKGEAIVCTGDVTKEGDCARIVQDAITKYGRVDILINNVGIGGAPGSAVNVDMAQWDVGMAVNVSSMVLMAKFAIPEMLKNEGEIKGTIVNLGSVAALGGGMKNLLYQTSKGAIVNMTKTMAYQHGKEGIRVNCVCPGSVWTPLISEIPQVTQKIRQARASTNMLGIEGYGWDTGYAVRWLAGPESRWVTGAILPVDAGLSATINLELPDIK
ncbi:short chain dehydrogenase reductase [Fusarium oxysporum f. sp. albedinis]|nr:short chain dehydrogenase reductase [Fusarium oxysporum f. sp. albedinis]KAK2469908.1 hypothetical protein H9L39_18723 [Fusarium oxysporum f. sp. albedinis]